MTNKEQFMELWYEMQHLQECIAETDYEGAEYEALQAEQDSCFTKMLNLVPD